MTTDAARTPEGPTIDTFWRAGEQGHLSLQHCASCGYVRWPPAGVCPECLHRSNVWKEYTGGGTLWSFVVYHHAYRADVAPYLPYIVGLVELDNGVRLVSHLVDPGAGGLAIGQRLKLAYRPVFGGPVAPVFAPAD